MVPGELDVQTATLAMAATCVQYRQRKKASHSLLVNASKFDPILDLRMKDSSNSNDAIHIMRELKLETEKRQNTSEEKC
jgi:hypothetical protein